MPMFTSQFDRARQFSDAYAGDAHEARFWTPATIGVAAAGAGVAVALLAADVAADDVDLTDMTGGGGEVAGDGGDPADWATGWGEDWDTGWDTGFDAGPAAAGLDVADASAGAGDAWSHHGDYTDASVGGDGDFFYFIDGDSSLTID